MKPLRTFTIAMLSILAMSCSATQEKSENPVLTVSGGQIQGVLTDSSNVMVYKGVPYAAPPVGDLRWKKPQPVKPWKGVKVADHFGDAAVQEDHHEGEFYYKEFYWKGDPKRSEDCLYLNIWAPAKTVGDTNAKLPVAFWVHGGAYLAGWGNEITMDGDDWAQHGVILVTINYRLGIFGFLSHPALTAEDPNHVSGNYGTYDQVAALKWVKENIAQFGGDPNNIMVFGQSAGGASIKNLISSPLSKDIMSKAIIESGGGMNEPMPNSMTQEEADRLGKEMMDAIGLNTLEKMRAATPEKLYEAFKACQKKDGRLVMKILSPHQDGILLTESFKSAFLNCDIADIPYMIGYNANDMSNLGSDVGEFCAYRNSHSKQPAYSYYFKRALPGDDAGAYHSAELWYVFHTLKNSWRPFTKADYELSDKMVNYWTNFAKYGNPNGIGGNNWKPNTKEHPFQMVFDIEK